MNVCKKILTNGRCEIKWTHKKMKQNMLFKHYCLVVQALSQYRWGVGMLEKLKWLFDENIYQNKMETHMTNSITIFEERQVE